jgi:hypothetical protein
MATLHQANLYDTTRSLLDALYAEMQELSKKKPEATLSESKVKLINRLLEDVRIVLKDEPEFKYLDLLVNESLPQNSDVVLILSQYKAAMESFRENYYRRDTRTNEFRWFVDHK